MVRLSLPRQTRVGAAIDAAKAGGPPLILAIDADVRTYATGSGDRRVVALGAEQWLAGKRVGIRAGARFNRVGARERATTAGVEHCGPQRFVCRGSHRAGRLGR